MEKSKGIALVTGGNGFTGRFLCDELAYNGYQVCTLKSNILDFSSLKDEINKIKPDFVFHLAAYAFIGGADSNRFYEVNTIGTRNLLEAISLSPNIKGVLVSSSANVYGNAVGNSFDESQIPAPANDYAVSKFSMEKVCSIWSDKIPIVIVRPFNYTGVGQSELFIIPKIINHFKSKSESINLGNIDIYREFNDVRDVVRYYRLLVEHSLFNDIFNVCTGNTYSIGQVINLCSDLSGYELKIIFEPKLVRRGEVNTLFGNPSKLFQGLGVKNNYGLLDTLKWMYYSDKNKY